jgi:peptide/nickel transport system substrate-binding protein
LFSGALAAGGLMLAGCGGGNEAGGTSSSAAGSSGSGPAGASGTPSGGGGGGGGTIRVGIPSDVTPDSAQVFQAANQPLRRTVFDYLLDKNPDGSYRPALASAYEWNADKTSLVLTLQDGVTYHTGRAFGPDDVVYSVKTAMADGSKVQASKLLSRASDIAASGKNQVTVTFDKPFTGYLDALAMLPMIDEKTSADLASGKQVVGTGPFTWKSWTPGSTLQLARNADYWHDGLPYADAVEFSVIKESQAMLAAIQSGSLDLVNRMIPRDAAKLKEDSGYSVQATEGFDVYVGVNVAVKPLDDIKVRQAIAYGLDRKRIADQVYSGFAEPSCVPWSSSTPGVTDEMVGHYTYDVDKGKALLEEAGAAGTEVELTSFASDPAYAAIADIVQYGLEQIGLKIKPASYDQATFVKQIQTGSFKGLWVTPVALTTMGLVTAMLTANPLKVGKNAHNFTDPQYEQDVNGVLDATSDDAFADANATLTNFMLEQAYHNTVVQAQTPNVGVAGLSGVAADLTLAIDLTKAKLA